MKMKTKRIAAMLLVFALVIGIYSTEALMANEDNQTFYTEKIKPNMDNIGDPIRNKTFSDQKAFVGYFRKAKKAIKNLKTVTKKKQELQKDKKIQKALKNIESYIKAGYKQAKKGNSGKKKAAKYQEKILKQLKVYRDLVVSKLNVVAE